MVCNRSVITTFSRYPSHSLLRFLLVSNSLDLILDVVLEMWGAVVGMFTVCLIRLSLTPIY